MEFTRIVPVCITDRKHGGIPIYLNLTHSIPVDSSTVICWMSLFVILAGWDYFVAFILFFYGKSS